MKKIHSDKSDLKNFYLFTSIRFLNFLIVNFCFRTLFYYYVKVINSYIFMIKKVIINMKKQEKSVEN